MDNMKNNIEEYERAVKDMPDFVLQYILKDTDKMVNAVIEEYKKRGVEFEVDKQT